MGCHGRVEEKSWLLSPLLADQPHDFGPITFNLTLHFLIYLKYLTVYRLSCKVCMRNRYSVNLVFSYMFSFLSGIQNMTLGPWMLNTLGRKNSNHFLLKGSEKIA
jgi:hypothetical protein